MNESASPKVNICGTGISNVSLAETIDLFDRWITGGEKKRVCITPVNCVVWAARNPNLQEIYNSADLTLCDGVPLIWASKLLHTPLKGRVTGLDLLPRYLAHSHQTNISHFFLGAKEGVAAALREKYDREYPGIRIAGIYSPPYAEKFGDEENAKIISLVNAVRPDIVWVSLTAPKQDYWIHENISRLNAKVVIGVGGAFEVAAGTISRAPLFMQRNGLEWLYRLVKEPARLFKRYLIEAPAFIPLLLKQWAKPRK
jgi:N-acetylglucosaminyldiphosphoundecaprenol N-acetyl-beta-D-mannosaminyltransferase